MSRSAELAIRTCLLLLLIASSPAKGQNNGSRRRPVTVADAIGMTRLALDDTSDGISLIPSAPAHLSPDAEQFVIVLKRGDLGKNTNEFSLLRFRTTDAFRSPKPDLLLTMTSTSSRDAIKWVQWLDDNETLAFLGENSGETSQVYTFNVRTNRLERLTSHDTEITSYLISSDGREFIFTAEPQQEKQADAERDLREGVVIGEQKSQLGVFSLAEFLAGVHHEKSQFYAKQLFLQHRGQPSIAITAQDAIAAFSPLSISPDGRYALIAGVVRQIPAAWASYQDKSVQDEIADQRQTGSDITNLKRYAVFDMKEGSVTTLLDAPIPVQVSSSGKLTINPFTWAHDGGHSALIRGAFLPLEGTDPAEHKLRETRVFDIEVDLSTKAYHKVTKGESKDQDTAKKPEIEIHAEEDLNTPPKFYVSNPTTHQRTLLMDLNPQFASLNFGVVKKIEWTVDGVEVLGGLYLPPDWTPGKRYPLVIQTHGFIPEEFSMDGRSEWSSGFAARLLAAKGIIVLQTYQFKNREDRDRTAKPGEWGTTGAQAAKRFALRLYETAIDYLDKEGMIDRDRVGISGFSRTVCFCAYTLTHSSYRFRAAILTDGTDCSYFSYLAFPNGNEDDDALNGGAPFGEGLKKWVKEAPGFNLDKVQAPVRLVALGPATILEFWEWFEGLKLQNKPVDFVEILDATHVIEKPWARRVAMQGVVDWFTFWLKGEEDPDPAKAEQYNRWRELRKLQDQNEAKPKAAPAN